MIAWVAAGFEVTLGVGLLLLSCFATDFWPVKVFLFLCAVVVFGLAWVIISERDA